MRSTLLVATARYRLLATVCVCGDNACPCGTTRRRSDGAVHCPICRSAGPALELKVRGGDLPAHCTAGCEPDRVRALVDGDDRPLLALYGDGLSPNHARLLLGSSIAPHVASLRAYSTVTRLAQLERYGFARSQRIVPTLVIPTYTVHGEVGVYQARPDQPRVKDRRALKYETVAGTQMALDIPRGVKVQLGAPAVPLLITEGARKADAAVSIGLCCIAVLGVWCWRGTNEWGGKTALPDWDAIALKDANGVGRPVYLVFDSDVMQKPAVYLALRRLKSFLESRGAVVRVMYLPSGEAGEKVGLDDYIAAGHDTDDLLALATSELREPIAERSDDEDEEDERHDVDAGILDLRRVLARTWSALEQTNEPPTLFRFGGVVARTEDDHDGVPVVRPLDSDRTLFELAQRIRWVRRKETDGGTTMVSALPPPHVIRGVLATPRPPLPDLLRIVEAPIFASDGALQTEPGYSTATRSLYVPPPGFTLPEIPEHPSSRDITHARSLILDELLVDFPFVTPSEQAHAVALLLLPFVRELINGPTPLHLIEKPSPGTGATLLVDMLLYPILGHDAAGMSEATDEAEWRKRLTAKLLDGGPILLIDNLRRRLDSGALAAAITMTVWEDRVLGVSRMVRLPVRCAWVATGNNPVLSNEMTRRAIRIRLDAEHDQPWLRDDFKHPDLRGWAHEHRSDFVWATLVMGRAWIAAGRPLGHQRLGMFEKWASVIGGILDVAGISGFLGNLRQFYATGDFERSAWQAFLARWWDRFRSESVGVADLFHTALSTDPALDLGDKGERSQRTRLGRLIGSIRDRRFRITLTDGATLQVTVTADTESHNAQQWRLVPVNVTNVDERVTAPGDETGAYAHAPTEPDNAAPTAGRTSEDVSHVPHVHRDLFAEDDSSGVTVGAAPRPGGPEADDWEEI
jgi:hypothetical protein